MAQYQSPSASLWTGRASKKPLYWFQNIQFCNIDDFEKDSKASIFGILGYQGDEGVRRNAGRVGAKAGPNAIRQMMGGMSWHLTDNKRVIDFGDVLCEHGQLEEIHDLIAECVANMISKGVFPLLLGGGHDLAYAHFNGIRNALNENDKIGIINLDAHFDLREVDDERTSGTPFYQILEENDRVEYCCLGIQTPANNAFLFKYAKEQNVEFVPAEDFTLFNWDMVQETLEIFDDKVDKIYLTIDLDGFASSIAPGVSAPSPMGFSADVALKVIDWLNQNGKLISADVVELNPQYDLDNSTARLASRLIERLVIGIHSTIIKTS